MVKKIISKVINESLKNICILPEWTDEKYLATKKWLNWSNSLLSIHRPKEVSDIDIMSEYRSRLAYDELLANQLSLAILRNNSANIDGINICGNGDLINKLLKKLPFNLTQSQEEVIKEIIADQQSVKRMQRLLQGDVGSGKTVVSLISALNAVEAGKQVAIMAPTEILAIQHYKWISGILCEIDCNVSLLLGKIKGKERQKILDNLSNNNIDIVIGTHALFSESVDFADLGLVIIDEQHRFGVNQRNLLTSKGNNVDILMMSATPIPRTLTMTLFGDMDCSIISSKPEGRQKIETRIMSVSKTLDIIKGLKRVIDKREKIYWICPLIEESKTTDLVAAKDRYKYLDNIYKGKVGLAHGRMKPEEREEAMSNFRDGDIDILVATTVIEVGVDVEDATVIIIEQADRFGLSQLHQLRGRVGRSDKKSSCILLHNNNLDVSQRLKIMRESDDGFVLAEEDLRLRGGGDIFGTRQSGVLNFKVADLFYHINLLKDANIDANKIIQTDPNLISKRGEALKILLALFGHDSTLSQLENTKEKCHLPL